MSSDNDVDLLLVIFLVDVNLIVIAVSGLSVYVALVDHLSSVDHFCSSFLLLCVCVLMSFVF